METTNPRINVTLDRSEFDLIKQYAQAKRISLSQAMLKLTLEKLEDYEDMLLAEKALGRIKSNKGNYLTMKDLESAFNEL